MGQLKVTLTVFIKEIRRSEQLRLQFESKISVTNMFLTNKMLLLTALELLSVKLLFSMHFSNGFCTNSFYNLTKKLALTVSCTSLNY